MPLQTIGSARIANSSVSTDKIANSAVTSVKIADGSITTDKYSDYSITAVKVANNAITANNFATSFGGYIYDLDDVSYLTDGITNIFPLTYNTANVSVASPWNLMVSISGLVQAAYSNTQETVWLSYVSSASKGYTLDSSGNIVFADSVPAGSDVMIRVVPGTPTPNTKVYPFKPTDVLMGY